MVMTIKELAHYLPYKILIRCDYKDGDILTGELQGLSNEEAFLDCCDWDYKTNTDFKPILRPLSDLTKEIEEGKPMFFPDRKTINCVSRKCDLFDELSYNEIDYLIRNHFDVFGLIEKGEAIDINTL